MRLFQKKYGTVWCTIIEWVNSSTYDPNRKGILATLPTVHRQSLGQIVAACIPYEFRKTYNTRAYTDGYNVEIRNYGKLTVGRKGISRNDFFNYMDDKYPSLVLLDKENKKYVNIFEYNGILNPSDFADQIVRFTKIIDEFKKIYRSNNN